MILGNYKKLSKIAMSEFNDIVVEAKVIFMSSGEPIKLRLFVIDHTVLDIWLSIKGGYSYHWERKPVTDEIYRHNNAPHKKWRNIKSFPKHFHKGSEENVQESKLSNKHETAIREFLKFIREKLKS